MSIDGNIILSFFQMLNDNGVEYVLLRNIGNELPFSLSQKKDIDILIKKESKDDFHRLMKKTGWHSVPHPWDFGNNFVFLYAMDKLEFYENKEIHLDICYQLCCRSVNNGEWMPLDQIIQDSVWKNRRINNTWPWYEMGDEDQLIHFLTRCIFDKKEFPDGYKTAISELYEKIDKDELRKKLDVVFFKFSPLLLSLLYERKFESIVNAYSTFIEY